MESPSKSDINDGEIIVTSRSSIKGYLEKFFSIKNLGIECTPKCGGCKCVKCPTGGKEYTIQEECELSLIQDSLRYDTENCWAASYPWIKNLQELPNKFSSAKARLQSTERRFKRKGEEYAHK